MQTMKDDQADKWMKSRQNCLFSYHNGQCFVLPSLKTSAVLATASSLAACKNENMVKVDFIKAANLFLIPPCSLQDLPSFSRSSPQDSPEKATSHTKLFLSTWEIGMKRVKNLRQKGLLMFCFQV